MSDYQFHIVLPVRDEGLEVLSGSWRKAWVSLRELLPPDMSLASDLSLGSGNTSSIYWDGDSLGYRSQNGDFIFDWIKEWKRISAKAPSAKEPLARALGDKKKHRKIWDVTCGTGRDTLLMIHHGRQVVATERNPVIFILLVDALRRLKEFNPAMAQNIELHWGDPVTNPALADSILSKGVDCIFLDPMYNPGKRKALPRKEMQIFHELIGPESDPEMFFDWLATREFSKMRVVLKRPVKAGRLKIAGTAPVEFSGKSTRYDAWFLQSQGEVKSKD